MSGSHLARTALLVAASVLTLFAAPATAAPPGNDARGTPQALGTLPALVRGTTVDATLETDEPPFSCAPIKGSVWFSFTAPATSSGLGSGCG